MILPMTKKISLTPNTGWKSSLLPRLITLGVFLILLVACSVIPTNNTPTAILPTSSYTRVAPSATSVPSIPTEITPAPENIEVTSTPVSQPTPTNLPEQSSVTALPDSQVYSWVPVISGLQNPLGIANPGDSSDRLFILEQRGRIRIFQGGELLPEPYLDISSKVGCCGERGLLGLAFHPQYAQNGAFYVNYTDLDGNSVIARYQVQPDDPDRADPESERLLLYISQPYGNHNGGSVVFGPEGYLYLGLGDGGAANDPHSNGQATDTLLGKILRIDVDEGELYAIPPDNPYVGGGGLPEIWAYGLRNPWRFSFDRLTGDIYIGDVGQNQWEEINYLPAGSPPNANFGWNYREGMHPFKGAPPPGETLLDPVAEYAHDQGCSVTGGVVYRGQELPEWQGVYLYGDYCSGNVWGLLQTPQGGWQNELLFETGVQISSFGEDESGEVYLVDYAGVVYRLAHDS